MSPLPPSPHPLHPFPITVPSIIYIGCPKVSEINNNTTGRGRIDGGGGGFCHEGNRGTERNIVDMMINVHCHHARARRCQRARAPPPPPPSAWEEGREWARVQYRRGRFCFSGWQSEGGEMARLTDGYSFLCVCAILSVRAYSCAAGNNDPDSPTAATKYFFFLTWMFQPSNFLLKPNKNHEKSEQDRFKRVWFIEASY